MNELYEKYANLLLTRCLNITKEKSLFLECPVESIEFARVIAKQAYALGITDIYFDFQDEQLKHQQFKNFTIEQLKQSQFFNKTICNEYAKKDAAILKLMEGDSDLMSDIEPDKLSQIGVFMRESQPIYKQKQRKYEIPWCIASVSTENWAKKVFPNEEKAKEKLWDLIFKCCLINTKNPVEEWNQKIASYQQRAKLLNDYCFQELYYQNSLGTNLTVELPKQHVWYAAGKKIVDGKDGMVNMPSEEVFTSPKRDGVNGVVYSSKPYVYNGGIIDQFYLVFQNGHIVKYYAEKGQDLLEKMIQSDENSDMLGEVALVDYNSPISNSNVIFYNTLFDENAACHIALGQSFPKCLKNGENMTQEELLEYGLNQASIHEDLMIGTSDLTIVGTTYNKQKVKIFENGNFVLK